MQRAHVLEVGTNERAFGRAEMKPCRFLFAAINGRFSTVASPVHVARKGDRVRESRPLRLSDSRRKIGASLTQRSFTHKGTGTQTMVQKDRKG